jgi:hypothetical protein
MRCEIQVQTILNHAWAEMAHDTIYKEPELGSFGTRALDSIKTRMAKIARRYLVPAGYEFGKVAADFERLMKGEEIFKGEALKAIVDATDNNERVEALDTFADSVLPLYDDIEPEFHDILEALRAAAAKSRETKPTPINTPYGELAPKTHADVLRRIAKIIGDYRYVDPGAALDTLFDVYAKAEDEDERKPIVETAKRLAGHELEVWRRYGPAIQTMVVDAVARRPDGQLRSELPLATQLLETVLGTEISGTTATSGTMTLHRGTVQSSPELTAMRRKATELLKSFYGLGADDGERRAVLAALDAGTRPPNGSGYGNDLVEDLMESVAEFIEFDASVVGHMSWELRQTQESRIVRHARNARAINGELASRPAVAALQARTATAITAFRTIVDADTEYAIYKVLVGYDVVYPPTWQDERFRYQQEKAYREAEVDRLVSEMSAENAELWHRRVLRCAETKSSDLATFPMFSHFLQRAGQDRPEIVLSWLGGIEQPLARFLPAMLLGIQKSSMADHATTLTFEWIASGSWLGEIAWVERSTNPLNEEILAAVVAKAVEIDDRDALRSAMSVAGLRFNEHPGTLVARVFMPTLRHMAHHHDTSWLGHGLSTWFHAELIESLDEDQATETLAAIVYIPELDHGASHVVAAIAKKWHHRVLAFLSERERIEASDERPSGYRAVPFAIEDDMREALAAHPDDLIAMARTWFDAHPGPFEWSGGRMIARTFPELDETFTEKLVAIVADGRLDDAAFVVAILNGYEGSERIDPVIKAVVAATEPGGEVLEDVRRALRQSGVVMGEFGYVERLENQLARVRKWLDDGNERVRAFAAEQVRDLAGMIAVETRRAEASRAARRLEWGEDLDES